MPNATPLSALLGAIQAASGPNRALDAQIELAMRSIERGAEPGRWQLLEDGRMLDRSAPGWSTIVTAPVTGSLEAAIALVGRMLPGWWWTVGTCHVSDDAVVAPDFNSPEHGERLRREFGPVEPNSDFDAGFDGTLAPPGNVPLALLNALFLALIAVEARKTEAAADA